MSEPRRPALDTRNAGPGRYLGAHELLAEGRLSSHPLAKRHDWADVLSPAECEALIQSAERTAALRSKPGTDGWTTSRHKRYATTDLPVLQLDLGTQINLRRLYAKRIAPKIELCFGLRLRRLTASLRAPTVASTLTRNLHYLAFRHFDWFVVKYDIHHQRDLAPHRDGSLVSYVVHLSDPADYEGGGTFFPGGGEVAKSTAGSLTLHCGKIRHGARPVTSGLRYILVGFVDQNGAGLACDWLKQKPERRGTREPGNSATDGEALAYFLRARVD